MKFKNLIIAASLMFAAVIPASAQYDYFAKSRIIQVVPTQSVNAGSSSNFCIDLKGLTGAALLNLVTLTNGACSAGTVTIYTGNDRTNWVPATYSLATSNQVIYTNIQVLVNGNYLPGPQLATNIINYAGVKTTPNAAFAGFATPYLSTGTVTYTNNTAITLSNATQSVGIKVEDQQRYLQLFYSFTGASTNTISGTLVAAKQQD